MDTKFWTAFQFALECAPPVSADSTTHMEKMVKGQDKYSLEDIKFVLLPVVDRYDLTVSSCHFITDKGQAVLSQLQDGEIPEIKEFHKLEFSTYELFKHANDMHECCDYTENDSFPNDADGYLSFMKAMTKLNLTSAWTAMPRYMWAQIYRILKGENPPTQDILAPLLGYIKEPILEAFLEKQLAKSEHNFDIWMDYANYICPSV